MIDRGTLHTIQQVIAKYLDIQDYSVFLFGSRAVGRHARFSDVDIGIEGTQRIPGFVIQRIKGDLEESDIPYRVDIVDFSTMSDSFKQVALKHAQIVH